MRFHTEIGLQGPKPDTFPKTCFFTGLDISPEGALFTDEDVHEGIAINKDLFLLVIQDGIPRQGPPWQV